MLKVRLWWLLVGPSYVAVHSVLMVVAGKLVSRVVVSELGSLGRDPTAQEAVVDHTELSEWLGQRSLKRLHTLACSTGIC